MVFLGRREFYETETRAFQIPVVWSARQEVLKTQINHWPAASLTEELHKSNKSCHHSLTGNWTSRRMWVTALPKDATLLFAHPSLLTSESNHLGLMGHSNFFSIAASLQQLHSYYQGPSPHMMKLHETYLVECNPNVISKLTGHACPETCSFCCWKLCFLMMSNFDNYSPSATYWSCHECPYKRQERLRLLVWGMQLTWHKNYQHHFTDAKSVLVLWSPRTHPSWAICWDDPFAKKVGMDHLWPESMEAVITSDFCCDYGLLYPAIWSHDVYNNVTLFDCERNVSDPFLLL